MTTTTSRVTKTGAIKLGFAALATAALTIGGLTPAYAADQQLGAEDNIGFERNDNHPADEYNYTEWHVGSVYNSDLLSTASLEFGECSVTTLGVPTSSETDATVTQVMKGFPLDSRPSTPDDIRAAIENASIDVESGSATLQFPFYGQYVGQDGDQTDSGHEWWGTFRNAEAFTGGSGSISGTTELRNSLSGEEPRTLDGWIREMDDYITHHDEVRNQQYWFELLGIGFTGQPGTVVNSITFDSNTYYFGDGDCLPEAPVDPADPETPETPATPKKPVAVETGF